MRRFASIVLLVSLLGLSTGALEYLHNLSHAREDARSNQPAKPHDESNCFTHAQLRLPTVSVGWVPLLVCLGILVAFLTEIATPLVSQRVLPD